MTEAELRHNAREFVRRVVGGAEGSSADEATVEQVGEEIVKNLAFLIKK